MYVCLFVCHTYLTMFPSSYHHEIFRSRYQWLWRPCKRLTSEVKGQGHRGQHPITSRSLQFVIDITYVPGRAMSRWHFILPIVRIARASMQWNVIWGCISVLCCSRSMWTFNHSSISTHEFHSYNFMKINKLSSGVYKLNTCPNWQIRTIYNTKQFLR